MYDYHVHTTYSDGSFLEEMVDAAAAAGLDGVGIADHCNVSGDERARRYKRALGFNLDVTYLNQGESPAVHGGRESDTLLHRPRSTLTPGYPP